MMDPVTARSASLIVVAIVAIVLVLAGEHAANRRRRMDRKDCRR